MLLKKCAQKGPDKKSCDMRLCMLKTSLANVQSEDLFRYSCRGHRPHRNSTKGIMLEAATVDQSAHAYRLRTARLGSLDLRPQPASSTQNVRFESSWINVA